MKNDFLFPIAFCSIVVGGIIIVWYFLIFDWPEKEKEDVVIQETEKSETIKKIEKMEIRIKKLEKEVL